MPKSLPRGLRRHGGGQHDAIGVYDRITRNLTPQGSGDAAAGESAGIDHSGFIRKDAAQLDAAIALPVSLGTSLLYTLQPYKQTACRPCRR